MSDEINWQEEAMEQARLNGMGAERELKLMAERDRALREVDELRHHLQGIMAACNKGAHSGMIYNIARVALSQSGLGTDLRPALERVRQIAIQSEAAPLSMCEIVKRVDMALGEDTPLPEWMAIPAAYGTSNCRNCGADLSVVRMAACCTTPVVVHETPFGEQQAALTHSGETQEICHAEVVGRADLAASIAREANA